MSSITLALAVLAGGCAGMEPSRPVSEKTDEHAGGGQADPRDQVTQQKIDEMRRAMASMNGDHDPAGARIDAQDWNAPPTGTEWKPDQPAKANPGEPVTLANAPDGATGPGPTGAPAAQQTLDQRIARTSQDLAAALRERADRDPSRAGISLAALASLAIAEPGVATAYMPDDATLSRRLTPPEIAAVHAWHQMSRDLPSLLASGDAGRGVADMLRRGAESIDAPMLSIPTATLCDRVDGYGIYRELFRRAGRNVFLAGRVNKAIVYVELEGFAFRSNSRDGEMGNLIELTQDFALYESDSKVLAWRMPNQDITDFSRNRRRDFYVLQVIELPATLSVGAYELKVSMRDRNGGAVAERVIPIDVVADSSALRDK